MSRKGPGQRQVGEGAPKANGSAKPPEKPKSPPATPSGVSSTCCDCGCGKQVK